MPLKKLHILFTTFSSNPESNSVVGLSHLLNTEKVLGSNPSSTNFIMSCHRVSLLISYFFSFKIFLGHKLAK